MYFIGVNPADGSVYRIHGFPDSLVEFEKLIAAAGLRVSGPEQAESVVDFYRRVNPESRVDDPILCRGCNCGGAPSRAQLEVSSGGHVGTVTFLLIQKS